MERKSQMTFKSSFGSKNTDLVLEQMAQVTENGCLNPGPNWAYANIHTADYSVTDKHFI